MFFLNQDGRQDRYQHNHGGKLADRRRNRRVCEVVIEAIELSFKPQVTS